MAAAHREMWRDGVVVCFIKPGQTFPELRLNETKVIFIFRGLQMWWTRVLLELGRYAAELMRGAKNRETWGLNF